MPDEAMPGSSIVLYQTEDGRTRVQCRFEDETLWLTQALISELFQKDVRTINEHLLNIFEEGELDREATIRKFRIVRSEGVRQVTREIEHYSLPAILAVGYRVRSARGTQFRQWATERLAEYLTKGFTLDGERLKAPSGPDVLGYFGKVDRRVNEQSRPLSRTKTRNDKQLFGNPEWFEATSRRAGREIGKEQLSGNSGLLTAPRGRRPGHTRRQNAPASGRSSRRKSSTRRQHVRITYKFRGGASRG